MSIDRDTVNEAIENAAGAEISTLDRSAMGHICATVPTRRLQIFRAQVFRFLDLMPEDATIIEIREAMER